MDPGKRARSLPSEQPSFYQEVIQVPVVFSMPYEHELVQKFKSPKQVNGLTSHIDLLPTLLGLAGLDSNVLASEIENHTVVDLVGADLIELINTDVDSPIENPDGTEREGVLFVTDDAITEHFPEEEGSVDYLTFCGAVDDLRDTKVPKWKEQTSKLKEGPVPQQEFALLSQGGLAPRSYFSL